MNKKLNDNEIASRNTGQIDHCDGVHSSVFHISDEEFGNMLGGSGIKKSKDKRYAGYNDGFNYRICCGKNTNYHWAVNRDHIGIHEIKSKPIIFIG